MQTFKQKWDEKAYIGADTSWSDDDINITLQDVLKHSSDPIDVDPMQFKHLLIDISRDESRIDAADLSYPIVVSIRSGQPVKILDGQHRVVKAMKLNQPIQVQYLDLDQAPEEYQQMFS